MFQSMHIIPSLYGLSFWLAQRPMGGRIDTAEEAARTFSGPEFLIALIAGVVLAFGFQLLITNLSVAAGISYLGHHSDSDDEHKESDSLGGTIRKIGTTLGMWTLFSVSIALFFACLLAVKLSLISSAGLGAIVGLVIWGTYFSLLVWVSSTTVGSLIGSVVNTATSGFQAIVGTATAALGAKAASNQMVATAEAAAAAVRRELGAAIDPSALRETVEDYIHALKPPQIDIQEMRREFEKLLDDPNLKEIAGKGQLPNLDRQAFIDLVSSRTDLSKQDVKRIAEQLQDVWNQVSKQVQQQPGNGLDRLVDYLKSAKPAELLSEGLGKRFDQLLDEFRQRRQAENPSLQDRAMQMAFNTLLGVVLGRTDLSDLDVEKILDQLKSARDKAAEQADKVASQVTVDVKATPSSSTLRADVENYLLNTYSWQMKPENIDTDFRAVLYDPEADPGAIRRELEQMSRSQFADMLSSRGVFTQAKIQQLADRMEAVRLDVLNRAIAAEEREKADDLRRRVEDFIRFTNKGNLTVAGVEREFKPLLEDAEASYEHLRDRLNQFDRQTLRGMLSQRQDLTAEEADLALTVLETTRDRVIMNARELEDQANAQLVAVRQQVESYLRSTGKAELSPEGIKRDLRTLLDNPQAGMRALRARFARFDRDTLVKLLAARGDMSEAEVNRTIDQVESTWNSALHAPPAIASKAKEQYEQVTRTIADYLRNTGKEELNPEGIQRDLTRLLYNPQQGARSMRDRLSHIDRDTIVKLLSQRQDLSEEQANRIVDSVQQAIRGIVRAPRRVATRVQHQAQDFQGALESYLRNTGKDELNPEGIKRDVQLLLNDPKLGVQSLADRLAHFDRSTIVALLSQRKDISEEEANRIVDQILSVRDQFVLQIQKVQDSIRGVIDGILAKIRDYLNSLNRPELNYEGIRRDVRKLFSDPEAGFDALRDRLSHFNRDTLVAIISSREDISEADANRIVDQIESARNGVLQRAEQLQMAAQQRLESLKLQAQRQAEETRKAAETASWWLFFTALISAIASAGAGALAVAG